MSPGSTVLPAASTSSALSESGIGPRALVDFVDFSAAHQDGARFDHPAIADEDTAAADQERAWRSTSRNSACVRVRCS